MTSSSSIDDIANWLDGIVASIRFDMRGRDQSLGRDLAGAVAEGISDRSIEERGPDGGQWKPNEQRYADWKDRRYHIRKIGIKTGQMLSLQSLLGETVVSAESVEMRYGIGAPPSRTSTGAPLSKGDQAVTDREKAGYFTDGGREFYGLDETIADRLVKLASDAIDDFLGG